MNAFLYRHTFTDRHTKGYLMLDGSLFYTIERAWKDNAPNVSCIPDGEYEVLPLARSASGKYRNVFHLQAVPGRSGILIHNGNLASHSKGCIILGKRSGILNGKSAVLNSNTAKNELWTIGSGGFTLKVYGKRPCLIPS